MDVELSVPYVQMSPSLDDVQRAVNGVAKKMLNASRTITRWGNTDLNGDEENQPGVDYDNLGTGSFFDEIASGSGPFVHCTCSTTTTPLRRGRSRCGTLLRRAAFGSIWHNASGACTECKK